MGKLEKRLRTIIVIIIMMMMHIYRVCKYYKDILKRFTTVYLKVVKVSTFKK